ncbi:MAG TPA: hypothetical protein VK484_14125, partial [Ferruginibacter sp.]|nr:hypothetical protein [Ferruginibacter sp.]
MANAQVPPIKDPSSPDVPNLPVNMPPAQLYNMLKDRNPDVKATGADQNNALKNRIEKDSLVKEATPQSMNVTEDTYGMHLFRSGVVA